MSIQPSGNATIYLQYSTLFRNNSQTGTATFQATVNGGTQNLLKKGTDAQKAIADILDLSPEGLIKSLHAKPGNALAVGNDEANSKDATALDTATSNAAKLSETDRIGLIRTNRNAVLERVNELLAEKGLEVPSDLAFDLKINLQTGEISASGIDDPELLAAFNDAVKGDETLASLMKKTREDLALPSPPNVSSRNFTIGFGSMIPTPEDAQVEYQIDVNLTQASTGKIENDAQAPDASGASTKEPPKFAMHISIRISNRMPEISDLLLNAEENKQDDSIENKEEDSTEVQSVQNNATTPYGQRHEEWTVASRISWTEDGAVHEWGMSLTFQNGASPEDTNDNGWGITSLTISGSSLFEFPAAENTQQNGSESSTVLSEIDAKSGSLAAVPWDNPEVSFGSFEEWTADLNRRFVGGMINWYNLIRNGSETPGDWTGDFAESNSVRELVQEI